MLNLIKNNSIYSNKRILQEKIINKTNKDFPSSTREWRNSIYLYNKNNLNLIPFTNLSCIKILKGYFSLFNNKIENDIRIKKFSIKRRKWSSNKIYISKGEFKHTNNKVLINLYLFNRQKKIYNLAMKNLRKKIKKHLSNKTDLFLRRLINIQKIEYFKVYSLIFKKLNNSNVFNKNVINIRINKFFKKLINNEKKKVLLYWYYKQMTYINKSKFTYTWLKYLTQHLYEIYNKQVELNLIDLKRFYYNSDIVSEMITKRISRKRKKTLRYLKKLKDKILIWRKNSFLRKYIFNKKLENKNNLSKSSRFLRKTILKSLKHKYITGFRLQAKGRISRRNKASRSVLKIAYKGNLLNIDSSLRGLSSVLLKGNLKSNVQYSKFKSKTSIGSFGIKGWISSN